MRKMQTAVRHLSALCSRKMRYGLLLAVANSSLFTLHSSLTSCAEEDDAQLEQRAVGFGTYTEQFQTRGELRGAIPDGGSMGVYAYLHDNALWATDAENNQPNFMWNQQATYSAEVDAFTYAPLKYWPNEESDKLSFIAYYPYTSESPGHAEEPAYPDNASGLKTLLPSSGTGLPTFSFTVKDAAASQVDLLVSDLVTDLPQSRDTEGDPGTPFNDLSIYDKVTFLFHHALAKVEIRVVADADIRKDLESFAIQSPGITLSNIYNDGTLTTAYSAGNTTLTWGSHSTTTSYTFKTYVPQLLMPQTLIDDATLSLTYTMTFKSDGTSYHYYGSQEGEEGTVTGTLVADEHYTYSNTASIQLNKMKLTGSGEELTEWLPNHHYIYTIRLRANQIGFTGQVVDWGEYETPPDIKIEE